MVGRGWKIALLLNQLKILQSLARPASKFSFDFPRRGSKRWEPFGDLSRLQQKKMETAGERQNHSADASSHPPPR